MASGLAMPAAGRATRSQTDDDSKLKAQAFMFALSRNEAEAEAKLRELAAGGNAIALEIVEIADQIKGINMSLVLVCIIASLGMVLPPASYVHMLDAFGGEVSLGSLFIAYEALSGTAKSLIFSSCCTPAAKDVLNMMFRATQESEKFRKLFSYIAFDENGTPLSIVQDATTPSLFGDLAEHNHLDKFQYATPEGDNFMANLKASSDGKGASSERSKFVQGYDGEEWEKKNSRLGSRRPRVCFDMTLLLQPPVLLKLFECDTSAAGTTGFFARWLVLGGSKEPTDYASGKNVTAGDLGAFLRSKQQEIGQMRRMATRLLVHAVTACVVVPNLIAQRIDVLISAQQQAMQPPLSSPPEMLEAEVPPVAPPASRTTRSSQKRPHRRKSWDGLGDDADVGSQPAGMPAQAARDEPPAEADDPADGHGQAKKKFKCDADYLQKLKGEMMYFCPGSTGEDSCQAQVAAALQSVEDTMQTCRSTQYYGPSLIKHKVNLQRVLPRLQAIYLARARRLHLETKFKWLAVPSTVVDIDYFMQVISYTYQLDADAPGMLGPVCLTNPALSAPWCPDGTANGAKDAHWIWENELYYGTSAAAVQVARTVVNASFSFHKLVIGHSSHGEGYPTEEGAASAAARENGAEGSGTAAEIKELARLILSSPGPIVVTSKSMFAKLSKAPIDSVKRAFALLEDKELGIGMLDLVSYDVAQGSLLGDANAAFVRVSPSYSIFIKRPAPEYKEDTVEAALSELEYDIRVGVKVSLDDAADISSLNAMTLDCLTVLFPIYLGLSCYKSPVRFNGKELPMAELLAAEPFRTPSLELHKIKGGGARSLKGNSANPAKIATVNAFLKDKKMRDVHRAALLMACLSRQAAGRPDEGQYKIRQEDGDEEEA